MTLMHTGTLEQEIVANDFLLSLEFKVVLLLELDAINYFWTLTTESTQH